MQATKNLNPNLVLTTRVVNGFILNKLQKNG